MPIIPAIGKAKIRTIGVPGCSRQKRKIPFKKGLRRPKIVCSLSYVEFRSRANTARGLDFGHMIR
jgi:hypothetical protein